MTKLRRHLRCFAHPSSFCPNHTSQRSYDRVGDAVTSNIARTPRSRMRMGSILWLFFRFHTFFHVFWQTVKFVVFASIVCWFLYHQHINWKKKRQNIKNRLVTKFKFRVKRGSVKEINIKYTFERKKERNYGKKERKQKWNDKGKKKNLNVKT